MSKSSHEMVTEAKSRITEVSAAQAQELLSQGAVVLDVREPAEFAAGHLPGAIHIPRGMLEFRFASVPELQRADKPLLVYCKSSGRAALATVVLHEMGAPQAVSLAGGFDAWAAEGFPVETPPAVNFD